MRGAPQPTLELFAMLGIALGSAVGTGCSAGGARVDWTITFADATLGARAARVEARVLRGGCTGDSVYAVEVGRDGPPAPTPMLDDGRYGLAAVARDTACVRFAEGCREVELPLASADPIEIVLAASAEERGVCPGASCSAGHCEGSCDQWDGYEVEPPCATCSAGVDGTHLVATTFGGQAYAVRDVGGPAGLDGRIWIRDTFGFVASDALDFSTGLVEVDDVDGKEMFEVFMLGAGGVPAGAISVYSPAGAYTTAEFVRSSTYVPPRDGTEVTIEAALLPGRSITLRVLEGATMVFEDAFTFDESLTPGVGAARYLRAGIPQQDERALTDPAPLRKTLRHRGVGMSRETPVDCARATP